MTKRKLYVLELDGELIRDSRRLAEVMEEVSTFALLAFGDILFLVINPDFSISRDFLFAMRECYMKDPRRKFISFSGLSSDTREAFEVPSVQEFCFRLRDLFPDFIVSELLDNESRKCLLFGESLYSGGSVKPVSLGSGKDSENPGSLFQISLPDGARPELVQAMRMLAKLPNFGA